MAANRPVGAVDDAISVTVCSTSRTSCSGVVVSSRLFTPAAMLFAQTILATPIVAALTVSAVSGVPPQVRETAPDLVAAILGQQQAADDVASPIQQLAEPLTEQELNILALIVDGKTNKQIADELVITLGTAKWHVHNILQKLGVNNRTQATIRAQELARHAE